MAAKNDNMGFVSESLPLNRSFDCEEDFEEAGTFSGCRCVGGLCIRIWPRRKRSALLGDLLSHRPGEAPEGRFIEEDVGKVARPGSGGLSSPKWKMFIRRFRFGSRKKRTAKFHYDAKTYALNFDDGVEREDGYYFSFSSRYAAPPRMSAG
ncbi:uncharacterized protein LOC116188687 [Punica granatum]|uniref:Uncharacterized protein LOC116188687 n=1 Tax=Punica granatum TaxID=22663 RepID=A0A6P8BWK5_PUNGR|nr:uncharacterized protein LOC116188687 [Punica granatum]